jgi:hypothetical protein
MTRDELLHLQQWLEAAGADRRLIVAVAEADQAWRVQEKAKRAHRRAEVLALEVAEDVPESEIESENSDSAAPAAATADSRKAIARKALLMARTLRPAARAVGAWLIERWNPSTGRCDPSVGRLVKDTHFSERSVRRAIIELVERGLFVRAPVGGRLYRIGFRPVWAALQALGIESENPDSAAESGRADSHGPQNHVRKPDPQVPRARDPAQREMLLPLDGGMEGAIRGKHRGDHEAIKARLAAWWGLTDGQRAHFRDLASFETWLRAHGPPRERLGGGTEGTDAQSANLKPSATG